MSALAADSGRIVQMASAFYESCVLFSASDLGIFGTIARVGECSSDAVASACGLNGRGARLLLDACVALGLLEKNGQRYRNTPAASRFLVPGAPGDLSGAIRYNRDVYPLWYRLAEMTKTGRPVERPEVHLGEDPERTRTFVLAMHGRAMGIGRAVVPQLELAGRRKLLDVGGGPGTYSMLIARANPGLRCTVLDLPGVVNVAGELIRREGMAGCVETMAGDYHAAPFPGGNDAVIFFGVLHQEPADVIQDLLRRAYAALAPGGVVYVLDMMTDASYTRPAFSALFAVNMALTTTNGWVFSDADIEAWITSAGFAEFTCRPLPPPMPHWLAYGRKPTA